MNILSKVSVGLSSLLMVSAALLQAGTATNVRTGETNSSLQTVINNAAPNDVLELEGTFTGNFDNNQKSLIFRGTGKNHAILDGNHNDRVFNVTDSGGAGVIVVFENIKFINGDTIGDGGGIASNSETFNNIIVRSCEVKENRAANGGGISIYGVLTVIDSEIAKNNAIEGNPPAVNGDGIDPNSELTNPTGNGGGIYLVPESGSIVKIVDSCIKYNEADAGGGGIASENTSESTCGISIVKSKVEKNSAAYGGGLYAIQTVYSIRKSEFERNRASEHGGGIYDNTGVAFLTKSTFDSNEAEYNGGAFFGETSTIEGYELAFVNNSASNGNGGALYGNFSVYDLFNSRFEGNSAWVGGGIYSTDGSSTYLEHVEIEKNDASSGNGGGFFNDTNTTLTVEDSELHKNSANGNGGGLFNDGIAGFFKSKITHNRANDGGGIYNNSNGILTLTKTKVEHNQPDNIENNGGTVNQ